MPQSRDATCPGRGLIPDMLCLPAESISIGPEFATSRHALPRDGLVVWEHSQNRHYGSRFILSSDSVITSKRIPELWLPVPLVICMKTYDWFNRNRLPSLLIPLLLAGFAAVLISAPTPAAASAMVSFNGTVSGNIISTVPLDECHVISEAVNGGNAMQLGRFNGTAEFVLNVCDLTYVGSYVFTAANGDSISGPFSGYLTLTPTPGVFDNTEFAFITAGTGRFDGATGHFDLGGQIDINTGTFSLPWQGTISAVGSTKH